MWAKVMAEFRDDRLSFKYCLSLSERHKVDHLFILHQ